MVNEVYRRGLMDQDSISTSRADQAPKLDNGFAMVPSGTLPGWASKYYEVFVPGTTVYMDFTNETMSGGQACIVINKESDHIEECLTFLNMLADPFAGLRITYGPEGDIWQLDGNTSRYYFGKNRARGLLITTCGKDVTIRNNTFIDCNANARWGSAVIDIAPQVLKPAGPVHKNVCIEENIFRTFDIPLLWANCTENIVFRSNKIEKTMTFLPKGIIKDMVTLENCVNTSVENNIF